MRPISDYRPPVLLLGAILLGLTLPMSQPSPGPGFDPALLSQLDSLKRVIGQRSLKDADKKAIRACDREKTEFLKQARAGIPEYATVDKALREAKLAGADPGDPAVLALMEKKFFEKSFEERFAATPRGKSCAEGEDRRRKALAAALDKDKDYQRLLRQVYPGTTRHL